MHEVVGNLHNHTTYSDGAKPHAAVAHAAIHAGLDFLVITDHNVWVGGMEGYYTNGSGGKVLMLLGEEVHDMQRQPQRNHLLVYRAGGEMAGHAQGQPPQALLDAVNAAGGMAFLAHPIDREVAWIHEGTYSWVDWDIDGYTGLELWNYMSSIKALLTNPLALLRAVFDPRGAMIGPDPDILALWDDLLREGRRVPVIGNADSHGRAYQIGPLRRLVFPYRFLFRAVNTHVLLPEPLSGDPARAAEDAAAIYAAIAAGHAYVGYGVPGMVRGFRFEALRHGGLHELPTVTAIMGDAVALDAVDTLRVRVPAEARIRLLRDGFVVAQETALCLEYTPTEPGVYRVEAWRTYRGRDRGWAFSNPIYVRG